jgi:hypothetical protein
MFYLYSSSYHENTIYLILQIGKPFLCILGKSAVRVFLNDFLVQLPGMFRIMLFFLEKRRVHEILGLVPGTAGNGN